MFIDDEEVGESEDEKSSSSEEATDRSKVKKREKHTQSQKVTHIVSSIEQMMQELRKRDIYFDFPDELNEPGTRQTKYRTSHTKGNTKNQRKKIKHQQLKILEATAEHLRQLMEKHQINPENFDSKDSAKLKGRESKAREKEKAKTRREPKTAQSTFE